MTPRSQKGFTMSHCCPLYFSLDTRHSTIIRVNPKFSRSSFYIYKHIQNTWKYWSCQAGSYTGVPQVLAASWGQCRMFNGNPNCDAASHPVPKFGVKDYQGLSRTIKWIQVDSSGSCPVPQLESDEALLEGLGRLGPRRSLGPSIGELCCPREKCSL